MRHLRRLLLSFLASTGSVACSTGTEPVRERDCTRNADCQEGYICGEALTCVDARLDPPRAVLGFDIQERSGAGGNPIFRAEIGGCDEEVEQEYLSSSETSRRRIPLVRGRFSQTFSLSTTTDEGDPFLATLNISQPSRFFRNPGRTDSSRRYPAGEDVTMPTPVTVDWARYHPANGIRPDVGEAGYVLWTISPDAVSGLAAPAMRYEMLVPPAWTEQHCVLDAQCCDDGSCAIEGACLQRQGFCRVLPISGAGPRLEYASIHDRHCDRGLSGRVVSLTEPPRPLEGATVSIRHDDRASYAEPGCSGEAIRSLLTTPPLDPSGIPLPEGLEAPDSCTSDLDCLADQACSLESERCELKVDGRIAGSATTQRRTLEEDTSAGTFNARVYTYCEGRQTSRNCRGYTITVTPPEDTVHPVVSFEVEAVHDAFNPDAHPAFSIREDLCVPDWGVPYTLPVVLSGDPVVLSQPNGTPFQCCDVYCLPPTAQDAAAAPPPPRETCSGRSSSGTPTIRFETSLVYTEALREQWESPDRNCHPPAVGEDDVIGAFRRTAECRSDTAECIVQIATGTQDDPREYMVRVEAPTGSLLGSVDVPFDATALASQESPPRLSLPLPRRALLRGFVRLSSEICSVEHEGDCGVEGALVLAERLRRTGETEANTPGPYFHQIQTHFDPEGQRNGAFVVPLDPGMYILTALPGARSRGGPARFQIIEIGSEDMTLERDLILEAGVLVTVDASAFDRDAQVTPLDTGSWRDQGLVRPGPDAIPVDLNHPAECLSAPTGGDPTGCSIRRLIGASNKSLTQVGEVQFTARDSLNATTCP